MTEMTEKPTNKMNKRAIGFIGIVLIGIGVLALIFIYKLGLINDFFEYIKLIVLRIKNN